MKSALHTLCLLPFLGGCVFDKSPETPLSFPTPPFASSVAIQAMPELHETKLMKSVGYSRVAPSRQYAFSCGNKELFIASDSPEPSFELTDMGLPLASFRYWGKTKAGEGFPFNNALPDVGLSQGTKAITASRTFTTNSKDDSLFMANAKLLDDGLIALDYSCAMPIDGKLTEGELLFELSPYARISGMTVRLGDNDIVFPKDDEAPVNKTLFNGDFSGKIVLFADCPDKAITIEILGKHQISVKALRVAAAVAAPNSCRGEIRVQCDAGGTLKLKLDLRNNSPEALETADTFAGINFWKNDRLRIPDFAASKNLIQNPSFEAGLRYYRDFGWGCDYPGVDRDVFTIDDTMSHTGKRCLKTKAWKDKASGFLSTFAIPTVPGKQYTFSCFARADSPGMWLSFRCTSGEWGNFPKLGNGASKDRNFELTEKWNRYTATFTAPNAAINFMFSVNNLGGKQDIRSAWLDDLQLEEAGTASPYDAPPICVNLNGGKEGNFFAPGDKMDLKLRIHAAANTKGVVTYEVEDFFYSTIFSGSFEFITGADGETTVNFPVELEDKLEKGLFVVKSEVKMADGNGNTDFHRLSVMEPVSEDFPGKKMFAVSPPSGFHLTARANFDVLRLSQLGFGSTNYQYYKIENDIFVRHGMKNSGSGIADYGPSHWRKDCLVSDDLRERFLKESYSDSLRDETARISFEMAKAYPWIKAWFLQGESDAHKFKCLEDKDYDGFAKLTLACRQGVLKADPTLTFMLEGGPYNMMPSGGIASLDNWLTAAEKIAPDVRFDAFAIHPYRPVPENPDLDADADTLLKMLGRHGYHSEPVYWNEGIYNCPWRIPEWGLDVHRGCSTDHWRCGTPSYHMGWAERISAAYYARSYLVALKHADRINQFNGWNAEYTIFDADRGIFALAKVPNTLCHLLGGAKFAKDIRFAANCRAYVFEDRQGRPVAALWSHIDEVDRGLERGPVAKMCFKGVQPEFIDLMENVVAPTTSVDGLVEVPVTPFPVFIRGKAGSLDSLCGAIANCTLSGSKQFPIDISLKLVSRKAASLSFDNRISRRFIGEATLGGSKFKLSIPEGAMMVHEFALPSHVPFGSIEQISLPLAICEEGGGSTKRDLSLGAFACAKGSDSGSWIELTNRWQSKTKEGTSKLPVDAKAIGAGDMDAQFKLSWDKRNLYLKVKVVDNKNFFPKGGNFNRDYKCDSVQIYIDTLGDNAGRKSKSLFDFNDYSYTLSCDALTGKARLYREAAPDQQVAGGLAAPKPNTVVEGVDASVTLVPDGYVYSVALPTEMLLPLTLKAGTFFRLGLMVNDNDGEGRKSGLVNTRGPGTQPYSNPEQWPGVILTNQ